ncbi:MAG: serine/threonine protein kinase [Deltaproteobacteria bacterium]|nr:serine/threonine protein kinase [Deltaproteobacteria bacterium]
MGEVYLARDTRLGRKVALKVVSAESLRRPDARERFLFEARATARFSHPHIVTVFAVGEFEGSPYVALEYLEGQSLSQRLAEGRPGLKEALRMGLAIADALREAHRHQILHRDLKPDNVIIPKDGRLRVVDFGLATVAAEAPPARAEPLAVDTVRFPTATLDAFHSDGRGLRGTPAYMAPEQWLEKADSEATDVWALGLILFELLCGRRPYDETSYLQLCARVCAPEPVPAVESFQAVPAEALWQRRDRDQRLLRRSAYEAMGGVGGALATHADGVLEGLSPTQLRLARVMLLRLVTPEGTRRALARGAVLEGLEPDAAEVLGRLVQARLLSARKARTGEDRGQPELELVHESLIRTWSRLSRWIDESREELAFLAEVGQAAELWERRGRPGDEVWRGEALRQAHRSLQRISTGVPELVQAFVAAGMHRERRIRRSRRLLASSAIAALVLVAVSSVLVAVALRRKEAEAVRERAVAERRQAESQREGARAALARGDVLEARAKLRSSLEIEDSLAGRALWSRLTRDPCVWSLELGASVFGVAIFPGGRTVAAACQDELVYLIDRETLQTRLLRGHSEGVTAVAVSPDGRAVASGTAEGEVRLWSLETGQSKVVRAHQGRIWDVRFSPDGALVASTSADGALGIWDPASGAHEKVREPCSVTRGLDFSPDGTRLGVASGGGIARIWDLTTGRFVELPGHGSKDDVNDFQFSADGRWASTASDDGTVRLWDVATAQPLWRAPLLLDEPPRLFTHRGWVALDQPASTLAKPPATAWQRAVAERPRAD